MAGVEGTGKQQPNNNFKPVKRTVKAKENWFKIASSYGINIHDLMRLNGFEYKNGKVINKKTGKEVPLNVGMMINVPDTSASTKTNKKETKKVPQKSAKDVPQKEIPVKPTPQKEIAPSVYTVQSGDALLKIADDKKVSIRQLAHANNWDVKVKNDKTEVYDSTEKQVMLKKGQELNIPKTVNNRIPATLAKRSEIMAQTGMSQDFLNIIVDFEGKDGKPWTKAYKDTGTAWTVGWGFTKGVTSKTTMTEPQANARLAKEYLQLMEDIKITLGEDVFKKLSKPMKEGLVDLIFNKGFEALDAKKFAQAINSDDLAGALEQLIFTKSIQEDKEYNGLYKRSLARLAFVYDNSSQTDKAEIKSVIDDFYTRCQGRGIPESELKELWQVSKDDVCIEEFEQTKEDNNLEEVKISTDKSFAKAIDTIKDGDGSKAERLAKTEALIDAYAEKYNLPKEAVEIFKTEAQDEYDSLIWIDTDNMCAMAGILDAKNSQELSVAISKVLDASDESQKFTSLVLTKKITSKEDVANLILYAGGVKNFTKMMKNIGGFDVLKHCLSLLVGKNSSLHTEFDNAQQEKDYSKASNVFENATAESPKTISRLLAETLKEDDSLDAPYYKHLMKKVNKTNVLDIMRSNDIISGLCEVENERSTVKTEIKRLFDIIDKTYILDETKRQEFLDILDKEFRERSVNPSTWWIGTKDIAAKFNNLISDKLKVRDVKTIITNELGFEIEDERARLENLKDKKGRIIPYVERFDSDIDGPLSGKTIVINAGHGGVGGDGFDVGAQNKELGVDEWVVTRFIAKRTIDKLLAQGANVVLTSGQVRKIPLESFDADARISLHLDAMKASAVERHKTQAMDVYAYPKDKQDKILGENIMFEFHNDSTLGDITEPEDMDSFKIDWNPKDGAMGWNIDAKPELEVGDTLRTRLIYNKQLQALRGTNKGASSVPAVLIEMCRMADTPKLKSLIMGEYGEAVVNSIVDGIERYLENEK